MGLARQSFRRIDEGINVEVSGHSRPRVHVSVALSFWRLGQRAWLPGDGMSSNTNDLELDDSFKGDITVKIDPCHANLPELSPAGYLLSQGEAIRPGDPLGYTLGLVRPFRPTVFGGLRRGSVRLSPTRLLVSSATLVFRQEGEPVIGGLEEDHAAKLLHVDMADAVIGRQSSVGLVDDVLVFLANLGGELLSPFLMRVLLGRGGDDVMPC